MGREHTGVGDECMRAIVFPGQGSQVVGMGRDLAGAIPSCQALFEQANEVLGYDLAHICFEGPQEKLNLSHHAQLGIFVASTAAFRVMKSHEPNLDVTVLAGHSLGEWTALHLAGSVGFKDALRILKARGEFMQAACEVQPGAMLAVMNLDEGVPAQIAEQAACHVANFNSPSQTVLSGTAKSIHRADELAKEAGAKRTAHLPVAGGFHSPLMQTAAEQMDDFLAGMHLGSPRIPVISNVTGRAHAADSIRRMMVEQIVSPVRWVDCVQRMVADGVTEVIECGPGKVLARLIKRIDKNLAVRSIGQLADVGTEGLSCV